MRKIIQGKAFKKLPARDSVMKSRKWKQGQEILNEGKSL
jgi:hypothetical protein